MTKKRKKKQKFDLFYFLYFSDFLSYLIAFILWAIGFVAILYGIWFLGNKDELTNIYNNISISDFQLREKQTIYYSDGNIMLTYAPDVYETITTPNEITDVIRDVTLSAEDERFYKHHGVDYKAIIRAAVANLKSGGNVQGASTITQQLVKLTYLNNEKSYERKLKEIFLARKVEKKLSKDEILMLYLNKSYYGNGIYGIADASQFYFSKSYKDLNYNEAATLIAIVNRPSDLEPINHFTNNQKRKSRILEIAGVQNQIIELNVQHDYGKTYTYTEEGSSCISYIQELIKNNNISGDNISTTIDRNLQIKIESIVNSLKEPLQASVAVIDNSNGKVIAIVGGKSTGDIFTLNRAYQSPRQTGSSIKPLLDYGVIFDNYAIDTTFEVVDKGGKDMPKNSNGTHIGRCTIKKAATNSINTVAFRLYSYLLDDGVVPLDYLKDMNFKHITDGDYEHKAVSIGGFDYGATVLEMASGYATLANAGLYREPTALKSTQSEPIYVYSPIAAYWTTDLLSDVAQTGTAKRLKVNVPISCKTGTTNNNKDAWLCGYTKDYSIAVWCGADNKNESYSVKSSGEALDIFQGVLDSLELVDEPIYSEDEKNFILNGEDYRKDPEDLTKYFNELSPKYIPQPAVEPTIDPNAIPQEPVPPVVEQPQEPIVQVLDEFGNPVN